MRLKYYATLRGFENEATRNNILDFYVSYMGATVVKNQGGHAKLRLLGQIDLYICSDDTARRHTGYHIIKFEDDERLLFEQAVTAAKRGISEGRARLSVDTYDAKWGTTFFEFVDPHGLSWVYEIKTAEKPV